VAGGQAARFDVVGQDGPVLGLVRLRVGVNDGDRQRADARAHVGLLGRDDDAVHPLGEQGAHVLPLALDVAPRVAEQDGDGIGAEGVLDALQHGDAEAADAVAREQADGKGPAAGEAPGLRVGLEAELGRRDLDPVSRFRTELASVVQSLGNGSPADAGPPGYVADGGAGHRIAPAGLV
jgi:hypothetical protein